MIRRPRGFALLVVMLIAVGTISIAASLAYVSGRARVAAIHVEGAEVARLLAETGAERALAWATEVRANSIDFDRVLDPGIGTGAAADCNNLAANPFDEDPAGAAPHAGTGTFVPDFTEAGVTTAVYPPGSGKVWRLVPDAATGGAYLVRFEDNNDERSDNPVWNIASNNNIDGANNCNEGPAVGGENLARDRDNAVWLVSMGIYPGQNPVTAVHRQMVRKLINEPNTPDGVGLFVGTNVDIVGGGGIEFHNLYGAAHVGINSEATPVCGTIIAGGTIAGAQAADCGTNILKKIPNTAPPPPTPAVGAWNARSRQFYDWTSPCNFYAGANGTLGFFYWDSLATYGSGPVKNCSAGPPGGDLVDPQGNLALPNDAGNCWTPIYLTDPANVAVPFAQYVATAGSELDSPPNWQPDNTGPTPLFGLTTVAAQVPGVSWYFDGVGGVAVTRTKPDWSTCGTNAYPSSRVQWGPTPPDPTPTGPDETCGASCNGGTSVLSWNPAAGSASLLFAGGNAANRALPTGVYFVGGNYTVNAGPTGCSATDQVNPDGAFQYPMITLAIENDYVQTANNIDVCWGVGSIGIVGLAPGSNPVYPSLIIGGKLDLSSAAGNATLRTAGSVWTRTGVDVKKELTIFGAVRIDTGFAQGPGGGPLVWRYRRDICNLRAQAQTAPLARVSYPTKF